MKVPRFAGCLGKHSQFGAVPSDADDVNRFHAKSRKIKPYRALKRFFLRLLDDTDSRTFWVMRRGHPHTVNLLF